MSYDSYACASVECAGDTSGTPVTRCADSESIISQLDADKKATVAARTIAYAALDCAPTPPPAPTVYLSAGPLNGNRICATCGGNVSTPVSVPAGAFFSYVSQAVADAAAAARLAELVDPAGCTSLPFYNTEQTGIARCPAGSYGAPAGVTVPAGEFCSMVSQEAADAAALAFALSEATGDLSCTYYNTQQTATITCAEHPVSGKEKGPPYSATVEAGAYSSPVSVAAANALALAAATAAAIASRTCYLYANTEQSSGTPDCETARGPGWTGPSGTAVVVPANTFFSDVSQAAADSAALAAALAQYADQLTCEFSTPP